MQVDRLGAFALLVRLHLERDFLPFVQRSQSGLLDGGDVDKNIPPTIARLDEAIALVGVEELDCALLRHDAFPPVMADSRSPARRGKRRRIAIPKKCSPPGPFRDRPIGGMSCSRQNIAADFF